MEEDTFRTRETARRGQVRAPGHAVVGDTGLDDGAKEAPWAFPATGGDSSRVPSSNQDLLALALTVLPAAAWCLIALAIGMNFASSLSEWLVVLLLGGLAPAVVVWQANRTRLTARGQLQTLPSAKDKENELLGALAERGELTPVTAAMRTSLSADEAAKMLDGLASKGYLRMRVNDGVQAYALPERGSQDVPLDHLETVPVYARAASGAGEEPPPLEEDLSERELEVLVLLASGRTNSEIARDLFVAQGTVKSHTGNIYRKLGAKNRAEALARARALNLLP